jgi:hypothetical protein
VVGAVAAAAAGVVGVGGVVVVVAAAVVVVVVVRPFYVSCGKALPIVCLVLKRCKVLFHSYGCGH